MSRLEFVVKIIFLSYFQVKIVSSFLQPNLLLTIREELPVHCSIILNAKEYIGNALNCMRRAAFAILLFCFVRCLGPFA